MAISAPTMIIARTNSVTSGTSLATSATVAAGSLILVGLAEFGGPGGTPTGTIVDDAGNSYYFAGASPASTSYGTSIYYSFTTAQLTSGQHITFNSLSKTLSVRAAYVTGVSGGWLDTVSGGQSGSAANSISFSSGVLTEPDQIMIVMKIFDTGSGTYTDGSGFAAVTGSGDFNYKIVSSRASVTYNPSWVNADDFTMVMCSFMAYPATASGARRFNGTTDNIVTTGNAGFTYATPFSISAWVMGAASAVNGPLVGTNDDTSTFDGIWLYWGGGGNTDQTIFQISDVSASHIAKVIAGSAKSLNIWYHIAVTYDGSSTTAGMKLYENGTATGSASGTFGTSFTNRPFRIGTDAGSSDFFNGRLSDAAVWTVALTPLEVAALASGARPSRIRKIALSRWWPINGQTLIEPDLSGNANNGTLVGTGPVPGPPLMPFTPRWPQFLPPPGGPFLVFQNQTITIPLSIPITATISVG